MVDENRFVALGGDSDAVAERLEDGWTDALTVADAIRLAVSALAGPDRSLTGDDVEVAVLERIGTRRCFRRFTDPEVDAVLAGGPPPEPATED